MPKPTESRRVQSRILTYAGESGRHIVPRAEAETQEDSITLIAPT